MPEITPTRFDVADVAGFKAHLTEHGYAVVKCVPWIPETTSLASGLAAAAWPTLAAAADTPGPPRALTASLVMPTASPPAPRTIARML